MKKQKSSRSPRPSREQIAFSTRFRMVSTRFPRRVSEAYDGDLARAMADGDRQVAGTVAAWERRQGLAVRDWRRIGRTERE
jgi:hypothetical protein